MMCELHLTCESFMPKLLKFVPKSDPILREVMPEVKNFNDSALRKLIDDMCYSILPAQLKAAKGVHESAAGMAANQWGVRARVFIYTPNGSGKNERTDIMINPSYTPFLRPGEFVPAMTSAYEGCFSIPLTTGLVKRFEAIRAVYYTPQGKRVEQIMEGWEARVFQHETDHLDGKLFDGILDHCAGPDCLERIVFADKAEMDKFWNKQ